MIGKGRLIYDATDPASGDSVAAFLRTGTDALTSTDVGGKKALDVNVANEITAECDLDGVYDDPDNLEPDSVGNIFNVRGTFDETGQTMRATVAAPSATIDPADVQGLDTNGLMYAWDGTDSWDRLTRSANGLEVDVKGFSATVDVQGNVADDDADSGDPVKVGFRAIDGALAAVSADDDRADGISDMYRRQYVNTSPNIALDHSVKSVTTTAGQLDGTPLAGRQRVAVQNFGNKAVYIGKSTVTASGATRGVRVDQGAYLELPWGEDIPIYGIAESGTQDLMFMELA